MENSCSNQPKQKALINFRFLFLKGKLQQAISGVQHVRDPQRNPVMAARQTQLAPKRPFAWQSGTKTCLPGNVLTERCSMCLRKIVPMLATWRGNAGDEISHTTCPGANNQAAELKHREP